MKIHQILKFFKGEKAALCSMFNKIVQNRTQMDLGTYAICYFMLIKYQDDFISKNKPVI